MSENVRKCQKRDEQSQRDGETRNGTFQKRKKHFETKKKHNPKMVLKRKLCEPPGIMAGVSDVTAPCCLNGRNKTRGRQQCDSIVAFRALIAEKTPANQMRLTDRTADTCASSLIVPVGFGCCAPSPGNSPRFFLFDLGFILLGFVLFFSNWDAWQYRDTEGHRGRRRGQGAEPGGGAQAQTVASISQRFFSFRDSSCDGIRLIGDA